MNRLLDEIHADPEAVFELGANLPSGNRMNATIGPLIGGRLCCHIGFAMNPASDEDVAIAKLANRTGEGSGADGGACVYGRRSGMSAAMREWTQAELRQKLLAEGWTDEEIGDGPIPQYVRFGAAPISEADQKWAREAIARLPKGE